MGRTLSSVLTTHHQMAHPMAMEQARRTNPAVDSGARSVTAAATAPAQAVQMPQRMLGRKLRVRPASTGMARIPMRPKLCLSAQGVLAFGV